MVRPLSNDLRKRVVAAVVEGRKLPGSGVAVRCCGVVGGEVVAALSGDRLFCARQDGRAPQAVLDPHRAFIMKRLNQTPHLTLHALKDELAGVGSRSRTTRSGCSCAARGCGSKKTLFALEQARSDVAHRRRRWRSWQASLDPQRLVFIDETWIKTNMAPLRGWGPKASGFAALRRTATGAR